MRKPRAEPLETLPMLPPLPGWIGAAPAETLEAAAFRSGAALAHLSQVTAAGDVPVALWRDRLALVAAGNCAEMAGRREGPGALRDALHLTGPGDDPGPAGRLLQQWSRAVARPVSVAHLTNALQGIVAERIALCLDAMGQTPVDRAAHVIEAVLTDHPRAETAALILADAVLAKGVGATHVLPLLALTLRPRDLRLRGDDLRLACHRAVVSAIGGQVLPLAGDLARAAARLRAVAPKLRAKAAGRAVDLFLSRDALAPGALAFMSDRAARRLCDRLVALGAVRELTGRDTFRLYGV
ncbi:DUF1403 family protein (plasmid) [Gemmobacter fulvus]|jgi:hypothetical protein|uniref:DUF1403 family protein n=1 Tax=Gemmobacter fulvus TaxID=2840474 RepID=A0A975PB48_9RHOB|nr:DUF1403 family protein [Gemmobacter fulvus]MBT9248141.1 DUF1403 family protein [Gemmobacter fulvus]QWK93085.1 DUF1403 family protein [Gemmobacter fulvus]QWK93233.1 DUF1403 family protein [Gemmobacter fulvus]